MSKTDKSKVANNKTRSKKNLKAPVRNRTNSTCGIRTKRVVAPIAPVKLGFWQRVLAFFRLE
jgi:hypothetical protein